MNPTLIPPRTRDEMVGATISTKVFLMDFPTPINPKIGREPTREALIGLYRIISGNAAFVASNLRGGRHGHLTLMITAEEYMEQTSCVLVLPHNPGNYPPMVGTAQDKSLVTEWF